MSSVPPPPPDSPYLPPSSPYEPPPPPPFAGNPIPWELRAQKGIFPALVETVQLFVTSPSQAWSRTRSSGDIFEPLFYAILVTWLGAALSAVWGLLLPMPFLNLLPANLKEQFGSSLQPSVLGAVIQVIFAPVIVTIAYFIWGGIQHLFFLMTGVMSRSTSGFEGTFRVLCYSSVSTLANVVPFVGGLIGMIWSIALMIMGAMAIHRTTQGRAALGVLLPFAICCVCVLGAVAIAGAAIFAALGRK